MSAPFSTIDRPRYLKVGLGLVLLKYALEAGIVYATTGRGWPPHVFLSPVFSARIHALPKGSDGLLLGLAALSLPFLFVGLSYSVRRAADAGVSPWWGLGFLVPGVNFVTIAILATLPTRPLRLAPSPEPALATALTPQVLLRSTMVGIGSAIVLGLVSSAAAATAGAYGAALFVGLPLI